MRAPFVVALLALAALAAAPGPVAGALSFTGTECRCTVNTTKGATAVEDEVFLEVSCEMSGPGVAEPADCSCLGVVASCQENPTVLNGGVTIFSSNVYLSGSCNHFCKTDEVSPGVCEHPSECRGAPCPDQALNTTESSTRDVVVDVYERCTSVEQTRTCSTPAICHCQVSEPVRTRACEPTVEDPCMGTEEFTRTVLQTPTNGGNACPSAAELVSVTPCDVTCNRDCQVSAFGDFTACSVPCGNGTQTALRDVMVNPRGNGTACPSLTLTQACTEGPCDCTYSDYVDGPCSTTCGGGTQTRTRTVLVPNANNTCTEPLSETVACVGQPSCPIDCVLSAYGAFSACPACGTGETQSRTRTVVTAPQFGGTECGQLTETVPCAIPACPVDCVVSAFGAFGQCEALCGDGVQTQTRVITTPPANGGAACPSLTNSTACSQPACTCTLTPFSNFSQCSHFCGTGLQSRVRDVTDRSGDATCDALEHSQPCNDMPCEMACVVSAYGDFSPCSEVCGGGTQSRARAVTQEAVGAGTVCPPLIETRPCNTHACARPCEVGPFGALSDCSPVTSVQNRTRLVTQTGSSGQACPALVDVLACTPSNGTANSTGFGAFGAFGPCSETCGLGTKTRTRTGPNGTVDSDTQPCDAGPCPCPSIVGPWTVATDCSERCGGGTRTDVRVELHPAVAGGADTPQLIRTVPCNSDPCPTPCEVSAFGPFGTCSAVCAGGLQTRTRTVVALDTHGGTGCPELVETRECNVDAPCEHAEACTVSDWGAWSPCGATCGTSTQTRSRTLLTGIVVSCPHQLSQTRACGTVPCPVDCALAPASSWVVTPTSSSCGTVLTHTLRPVATPASGGGTACPAADVYVTETHPDAACASEPCVMARCEVGPFGAFDNDCSGGETHQRRSRVVTVEAVHGGSCYDPLEEVVACPVVVDPTPDPTPDPPASDGGGGGLSTAAIAGIATGGALVVGGVTAFGIAKYRAAQSAYEGMDGLNW